MDVRDKLRYWKVYENCLRVKSDLLWCDNTCLPPFTLPHPPESSMLISALFSSRGLNYSWSHSQIDEDIQAPRKTSLFHLLRGRMCAEGSGGIRFTQKAKLFCCNFLLSKQLIIHLPWAQSCQHQYASLPLPSLFPQPLKGGFHSAPPTTPDSAVLPIL